MVLMYWISVASGTRLAAEPAPPVHPSEALCWPGSRYIVYRGSMVIVTCEKLQALKFRDRSITSEWCRAGK
jgi:hypothetical protein